MLYIFDEIKIFSRFICDVKCMLQFYVRRFELISISMFIFFISIVLFDGDVAGGHDFLSFYHFCLISFIITFKVREIVYLMSSFILILCFFFLFFLWLSPLWTGGMPFGEWKLLGQRSLEVYSCALIVAGAVYYPGRIKSLIPIFMALILFFTAIYSIFRFFYLKNSLGLVRLVTFPWPNENTGPEIYGLFIAAIVFSAQILKNNHWSDAKVRLGPYPHIWGSNAYLSLWKRSVDALVPWYDKFLYWFADRFKFVKIFLYIAAFFLLVDIILAGTRAAILGLLACFFLFIAITKRDFIKIRLILLFSFVCLILIYFFLFIIEFDILSLLFRGASLRDQLLVGFWNIAIQKFWLGHGMQNEFKYQVLGLAAPHNQLLTALLYGGVCATILLISIYASMFYFGYKFYLRYGSFAIMSMTAFLVVHGMFETIIFATTPDWRWLYLWVPPGLAAAAELKCRAVDPVDLRP